MLKKHLEPGFIITKIILFIQKSKIIRIIVTEICSFQLIRMTGVQREYSAGPALKKNTMLSLAIRLSDVNEVRATRAISQFPNPR